MKEKISWFSRFCFKILRWIVLLFYPKIKFEGLDNLPDEACIIVGNHSQINGPIISELFFPGKKAIWCAGQMMELKSVPAYAYKDFWSYKPKYIRWFYKILSYLIAPISVCLFENAQAIGVYRDSRVISTFKRTIKALNEGRNIIIFPECYDKHNNIIYKFQSKFIDIARFYYKRAGKNLQFVPMYIAPNLKSVFLGKPTRFNSDSPIDQERQRICDYLMDSITEIAVSLPRHTVVPYANIPKKDYPVSIPYEEAHSCEKARS